MSIFPLCTRCPSLLLNVFLVTYITVYCAITSSSKVHYIIDARVAMDAEALRRWTNVTGKGEVELRREMNSIMNQVSVVYLRSLLLYDLRISIKMKEFVVLADTFVKINSSNGMVKMMPYLKMFRQWALDNHVTGDQHAKGSGPLIFTPERSEANNTFDMSILFTGYDLYFIGPKDSVKTQGLAYLGGVCDPGGVAVLEHNLVNSHKNALIAAHEIAHLLGARHDGIRRLPLYCDSHDGYVMAQVPYTSYHNHTMFSKCSATLIRNKLETLTKENKNCLTD